MVSSTFVNAMKEVLKELEMWMNANEGKLTLKVEKLELEVSISSDEEETGGNDTVPV